MRKPLDVSLGSRGGSLVWWLSCVQTSEASFLKGTYDCGIRALREDDNAVALGSLLERPGLPISEFG